MHYLLNLFIIFLTQLTLNYDQISAKTDFCGNTNNGIDLSALDL